MHDAIAALREHLADRYQLEHEIGSGGMATVYLANDLKHDRKVAIKVLHEDLGATLGPERFLAEIKTTAKLQHPHVLPLIDSGSTGVAGGQGTLLYYVMPFVEGESLRGRLTREKQLPITDAVRIAREVADALEFAHAHGIVHRDIKPENILLQGGHALVADFGIALAVQHAGGTRLTQTGLSLGTPQYMAPEQAMGDKSVDARADIYALGAVTYEMLVGEPPFTGATVQAIVAKVLNERPTSITTIRDTVPRTVERAVETALAKLPADRFASARAFATALEETSADVRERPKGAAAWSRRSVAGLAIAIAVTAGVAGAALRGSFGGGASDASRSPVRLVTKIPAGTFLSDVPTASAFALAPDGGSMVYVGENTDRSQLFIKRASELGASAIPGTVGAASPFYLPDGRWLAFFSGNDLMRVPVGGGPVQTVLKNIGDQASWGADGTIAYHGPRGLEVIPAAGGTARQITTAPAGDSVDHAWPFVLPSGGAVLFTVRNWLRGLEQADVAVVSLKTLAVHVLVKGAFHARLLPNGYLLFGRANGTLEAVRFDPHSLSLIGKPVPVLDSVRIQPGGEIDIATDDNGTLVYLPASTLNRRLMRVDRSGRATPLLERVGMFEFPTFSPDGKQIAARVFEPSGLNLYVYDLKRGTGSRLARVGAVSEPAWKPDGRTVAVLANRTLYELPADGSGTESVIRTNFRGEPQSWLPDGRRLVVTLRGDEMQLAPGTTPSLGIKLVTAGDTSAIQDLAGGSATQPALSRDGDWLAYVSAETGREEVYLRRLSGSPRKWPVSAAGGSEPRWRPDGRELFYRRGREVIGVPIQTQGADVIIGTATTLFEKPYVRLAGYRMWDVAPIGQDFVMVEGQEVHDEFITVLNWFSEVTRRVGR